MMNNAGSWVKHFIINMENNIMYIINEKNMFYWSPRQDKRHHLKTLCGAKCDQISRPPAEDP